MLTCDAQAWDSYVGYQMYIRGLNAANGDPIPKCGVKATFILVNSYGRKKPVCGTHKRSYFNPRKQLDWKVFEHSLKGFASSYSLAS